MNNPIPEWQKEGYTSAEAYAESLKPKEEEKSEVPKITFGVVVGIEAINKFAETLKGDETDGELVDKIKAFNLEEKADGAAENSSE